MKPKKINLVHTSLVLFILAALICGDAVSSPAMRFGSFATLVMLAGWLTLSVYLSIPKPQRSNVVEELMDALVAPLELLGLGSLSSANQESIPVPGQAALWMLIAFVLSAGHGMLHLPLRYAICAFVASVACRILYSEREVLSLRHKVEDLRTVLAGRFHGDGLINVVRDLPVGSGHNPSDLQRFDRRRKSVCDAYSARLK
jgi:hypothetical protein